MPDARPHPCHTCRRQRLRCDAAKPRCQKCATRRVECQGYGPTPVRWLQPQSQQDGKKKGKKTWPYHGSGTGSCIAARGRPKLVYMPEGDDEESGVEVPPLRWYQRHGQLAALEDNNYEVQALMQIDRGLKPTGYDGARMTLSSLSYLNEELLCHLVRTDGPTVTVELPLEYWCYYPDMVLDTIVPTVLMHQVIRCRWTPPSGKTSAELRLDVSGHPSQGVLLEHKQATLGALRREMEEPGTRYGDAVLVTIINLMGLEMQQSSSGPWLSHFHAAKAIIAHRGGVTSLVQSSPELAFNASRLIIADITSLTTSPSHNLTKSRVMDQLGYLPYIAEYFQDGLSVGFPCADILVKSLVEINHARFLTKSSPTAHGTDQITQKVIHQILSFEPASWAKRIVEKFLLQKEWTHASRTAAPPGKQAGTAGKEASRRKVLTVENTWTRLLQSWEALAMAFKAAVLLYCLRTLPVGPNNSRLDSKLNLVTETTTSGDPHMSDNVEQTRKTVVEVLLRSVHEAWSCKQDLNMWSGRFLLWPIVVAGLEMDSFSELEREKPAVCRWLHELCPETGGMTPLDAVELLETVWEKRRHAGGSAGFTWLDALSASGRQGVFH